MSELQKLVHGEENWDVKVNKIIEYLESGQAIAGLKLSDWSTDGLVLDGSFKWNANSKGYRYVQLPNGKGVELDLKFSPADVSGLVREKVVTIPDNIRASGMGMNAGFWDTQSNVYKVRLWDNFVSIYRVDNDGGDKWNGGFYVHALYFHHD